MPVMTNALSIRDLSRSVTQRKAPLFDSDVRSRQKEITEAIGGARILVVGGAGSIGSSTIRELVRYDPASLHVVDISENNLVELVRDLRGGPEGLHVADFRALPIDYGSPVFHGFLAEQQRYDLVLNFAALKHVRSEKDVPSLLQMIDTNIVKQARLVDRLIDTNGAGRFFSVSTDKAANPVNLMGATKRLMEHIIFTRSGKSVASPIVTSARFANVAFSDGSLLHGWTLRLAKGQPLPVPSSTRRYFLSLEEAGQLCLLASVCCGDGQIAVPKTDPDMQLRELTHVAKDFLAAIGMHPREYLDESTAKSRLASDMREGFYPILVTRLDTDGEKPYEEFVGADEVSVDICMDKLMAIPYLSAPEGSVERFLSFASIAIVEGNVALTKEQLVAAIEDVVPTLRHHVTGNRLDDRF